MTLNEINPFESTIGIKAIISDYFNERAQIELDYANQLLHLTKRYSRISLGLENWNNIHNQSIKLAECYNNHNNLIQDHIQDGGGVTQLCLELGRCLKTISTTAKSALSKVFGTQTPPMRISSSYSESKTLNRNEKKKFFSSFSIRRRAKSVHSLERKYDQLSPNVHQISTSLQPISSLSENTMYHEDHAISQFENPIPYKHGTPIDGFISESTRNPRIEIKIKNDVFSNSDEVQNTVALKRVASLSNEKCPKVIHDGKVKREPSGRLRGRREVHSIQTEQIKTELPEISIDVHETIDTTFLNENGGTNVDSQRAIVTGEVYLSYKGPYESATPICFQLDYVALMYSQDIIDDYISRVEGAIYKVNINRFKTMGKEIANTRVLCFKYLKHIEQANLPISVKPTWKCEQEKSRLLVKYHKHPALLFPLENVLFTAGILNSDIQSVQSLPQGEFDLEQRTMKWDIGQVDREEGIIRAQFIHHAPNIDPQPITIRFELNNQLLTPLEIEQGTDPRFLWAKIRKVQRNVKSGRYIANV